jgi:hypothetical protein
MKVYNITFLESMSRSYIRQVLMQWLYESCEYNKWEWILINGFHCGIKLYSAESATAFKLRWAQTDFKYRIGEVEYDEL